MTQQLFRITESDDMDSATLTFRGAFLEVFQGDEFREACDELVATDRKYLILDLRKLENIRSQFIGIIIKLADEAEKSRRRVAVVASKRVNQMLAMFASDVGLELKTEETSPPVSQ
jgi:anti-anti-sigma regulatory factor